MIVKKRLFIMQFTEMIRRHLEQKLEPEENFEQDYIEKACDLIEDYVKHLKGGIGDEG